MRILILGATGLLARESPGREWDIDDVTGTSSRDADVRDPAQLRTLFTSARPTWTMLAAAHADVDGCEKDSEIAHQVNCGGLET